jgi:hypothetical protein
MKTQDYGIGVTANRNGNFNKGEAIEGSFKLIGMAQIVEAGKIAPPRTEEPPYKFENGIVTKVSSEGEIIVIQVRGVQGIQDGAVELNQMSEYSIRSKFP